MTRPERIILWLAMLTMPVAIAILAVAILGVRFGLLTHEFGRGRGHEIYLLIANVAVGFTLVSGTLWLIASIITLFDIEARQGSRLHKTIHSTLLLLTFGLSMIPWFFNHAHQPRRRQKD